MRRWAAAILWVLAELWQVFFGALTSLQLGAGVDDRAFWAPNVLVAEAFTVLPLGFALLLWGGRTGRRGAIICGLVMAGIAGAAAAVLGRDPAESLGFFAWLALPWGLLLLSVFGIGRRASRAPGPEPPTG